MLLLLLLLCTTTVIVLLTHNNTNNKKVTGEETSAGGINPLCWICKTKQTISLRFRSSESLSLSLSLLSLLSFIHIYHHHNFTHNLSLSTLPFIPSKKLTLHPFPHFYHFSSQNLIFESPLSPVMAAADVDVLRQSLPEVGSAGELHVLAVDDSHVDRKVIERLLKISSCKGKHGKSYASLSCVFF